MIVRLTKIGDEFGIVLEDALLEQLNILPDTPLDIEIKGGTLFVRRSREDDQVLGVPDVPRDSGSNSGPD